MGIWDVSRSVVRRWPLSVPLLVLTVAATALTPLTIRPGYVGTTYVSLLPPIAQRTPAPGQSLKVNPWDTGRLSQAVIIRLNATSLAKQIEAEGHAGTWHASLDPTYRSVIRIQVTASTARQARSTAGRLIRELDDEVARRQASYPDLGPADKITTAKLDAGDEVEVEVTTERTLRAMVVVAVAGVLFTALVSVSTDAVLRRRTRGGSGVGDASARAVDPAAGADTDATQPVVITNVPLPMPVAGASPATQFDPRRSVASEQPTGSGTSFPSPDDSTVVLPFSNAPWAERQKTAEPGNGAARSPATR